LNECWYGMNETVKLTKDLILEMLYKWWENFLDFKNGNKINWILIIIKILETWAEQEHWILKITIFWIVDLKFIIFIINKFIFNSNNFFENKIWIGFILIDMLGKNDQQWKINVIKFEKKVNIE
jgi:hypothetical protein